MKLSHSFSVEIATKYSVNLALVLQHFVFWYQKVESDKIQQFNGDYWVRMKLDGLGRYFPYFSRQQIRTILQKLIDENLLKKDVFNTKKNDQTRWYTLTQKAKNLLQISSVNSNTPPSVNSNTPSVENNICIYKEEDIIKNIYNNNIGKISKNLELLEIIAMENKITLEVVISKIELFVKESFALKKQYNNDTELFRHFKFWMRRKFENSVLASDLEINTVDFEEKVNYFLKIFNHYSRKQFLATDVIKKEFHRQLKNGFTAKQMATAVENLYSTNVANDFHKKTNYQHATPIFLLKDDNLNKLLNANFKK